MRSFYENDIRRRTKVLTFALAAWGLVVAGRLVQIQLFGHARAKAAILKQTRDEVKVTPQRGRILDRNGEILACSLPAPSVALHHIDKETPAEERAKVAKLKAALGLSESDAARVLGRLSEGAAYTYVKSRGSEAEAKRAAALKLPGLEIEPGTKRSYPHGAMAAHVVGGMSQDGENRTGVEARYNDILKGQEGRQIAYEVGGGRDYQVQVLKAPVPGRDITLTIDATIQHIAEKELAGAIVEHGADWGSVIIMDSQTGEILALANWPTFDLNQYPGPQDAWMNRAVQASYEPGSTFKIVAAAAAREQNLVGYNELFDCTAGSIRVGGTTITDHERFGVLSFPQVLIRSSNVGTVQFAQRLTIPQYHEKVKAFGFGRRTGIDLPREASGLVSPPEKWNKKSTLPHMAIGYEVSVTSIQTLVAMNAFATGGVLVRPRVVKDGARIGAAPAVEDGDGPVRVMSETIAKELVDRVFFDVVEKGTAKDGRLECFGAAGKTGTAQKYDKALGSYVKKYTASFVGFTPLSQPRVSIIVVLDEPKELYYGGQACAPVFRDIARQVLRYLRIPPERTPPAGALTADLRGQRGKRP
jgi:cell division protein FtsI/penicillin-binding protein 2